MRPKVALGHPTYPSLDAAAGTPLGALPKGRQVEFDAPSYSLTFADQGPFRSSLLRVRYSSLTQPSSTYDVNMATGALPGGCCQLSLWEGCAGWRAW